MSQSGTNPVNPTSDTTDSNDRSWFQKLKDRITAEIDKLEALFEEKKTADVSKDESDHLHQAKIDTKAAVVDALNSTDANTPKSGA